MEKSNYSTSPIIQRSSMNELEFLGGLSGVGTYNAAANEWVITNMTGDIQFRPNGSPTWHNYSEKVYKVKCLCGGTTSGGCTPNFVASDPPLYYCTDDGCPETCELVVTVTESIGGAVITSYNYGGDFRPQP